MEQSSRGLGYARETEATRGQKRVAHSATSEAKRTHVHTRADDLSPDTVTCSGERETQACSKYTNPWGLCVRKKVRRSATQTHGTGESSSVGRVEKCSEQGAWPTSTVGSNRVLPKPRVHGRFVRVHGALKCSCDGYLKRGVDGVMSLRVPREPRAPVHPLVPRAAGYLVEEGTRVALPVLDPSRPKARLC